MKSKIIIPIIIIMFCVDIATAGTLGVRLNNYDSDTYTATLEIQNWGPGELYDIMLAVDNSEFTKVLNGIRGDRGKEIMQTIQPGTYTITVKSSDGQIVSKTVTLQKSAATMVAERDAETQQQNIESMQEYQRLQEEKEKQTEEKQKQRQELIERLRADQEFAEDYFKNKSMVGIEETTTTTIPEKIRPLGGLGTLGFISIIALLCIIGLLYLIYKKRKK